MVSDMNLKTKKMVITTIIGVLALAVFFAGIIAGISIQQKYDYDKAFLDSLIENNRTCYSDDFLGGYCRTLTEQDCKNFESNAMKVVRLGYYESD
jgi:hypothetical protein